MLLNHRKFVGVHLNGGEPDMVTPLKFWIKYGVVNVQEKTRRYQPEKREFLQQYIAQLMHMGFIK